MHIYPLYSRNPTIECKCVCNRFYNFSIWKISRMYKLNLFIYINFNFFFNYGILMYVDSLCPLLAV